LPSYSLEDAGDDATHLLGEIVRALFGSAVNIGPAGHQRLGWRSGADLVGESLPCCLPGDSESNRDLVPRSAVGASEVDGLAQSGFVVLHHVGSDRDLAQVVGVLGPRRRIEFVGKLLEPRSGSLDLLVCASHGAHLHLKNR
jgi:hypothetical protein